MDRSGLKVCALLGVISLGVVDGMGLDISRGVVYKQNGSITLICRTELDPFIDFDIYFIWHHYHTFKGNFTPTPYDDFRHVLTIPTAGPDAAGTYECNIEGKHEVGYTNVSMVSVDETPVVGELGGTVHMALLQNPTDGIKCFRTKPEITEVTDCNLDMEVTELSIGAHTFVIASSDAIEHYSTPQNAMGNYTTFNTTKELIAIVIKHSQGNVTCRLDGSQPILSELELKCYRGSSKDILRIEEVESVDRLRVFAFQWDDPSNPFTVEISWKGKVLFSKRVKDLTSGATSVRGDNVGWAYHVIFLCIVVLVNYVTSNTW